MAGGRVRTIALIAHDEKKLALAAWVQRHRAAFDGWRIIGTATTASAVCKACPDLTVEAVRSGPLGGDLQIGAMIAEGRIDVLVFFPDSLTPMPHDVDVKALLRIALVYDIPCAFNPRSADSIAVELLVSRVPG